MCIDSKPLESWRKTWRKGIAPQLSTAGLEALRTALLTDDPRLLQMATTSPPPLSCVRDWPVEGACPIAFCGAIEHGSISPDGGATVAQAEEYFANVCYQADVELKEPAGCRFFLNHWDEMPRETARRELLAEVELTLAGRRQAEK